MDYHKNAPWTAVSRERLARLVIEDGLKVSVAASRFSVSAKTAGGPSLASFETWERSELSPSSDSWTEFAV